MVSCRKGFGSQRLRLYLASVEIQSLWGLRLSRKGSPTPPQRTVEDGSGLLKGCQRSQTLLKEVSLLRPTSGLTQRVSKRKTHVVRPGRLHLLANASEDGDADGADALGFNGSLDQTDRLVAEASGRHQERHIRLLPLDLPGGFKGGFLNEGRQVRPLNVPHEAEELRSGVLELAGFH